MKKIPRRSGAGESLSSELLETGDPAHAAVSPRGL